MFRFLLLWSTLRTSDCEHLLDAAIVVSQKPAGLSSLPGSSAHSGSAFWREKDRPVFHSLI
ncbi:hypothetical protein B7P43_G09742 [Cryptotermes secundus]|uniref:Uncharacterized protein n=1 Tax=Cryptotermes secundus TaxID=105785 RepID=A0A2J7Q0F0_9NEOP|nr:hypothetical protein B7P43_G09742 [Cryptotermes secundus]